jgi:GT2 family glycosyltransferase
MFVSAEVFQGLGGFDPDYFLYGEETDLCLRMRRRGYRIDHLQSVAVRHVGGASERRTPRQVYWAKRAAGRLLFYRKHCRDWPRLVRRELRRARYRLAMLAIMEHLRLARVSDRKDKYLGLHHACLRELDARRR